MGKRRLFSFTDDVYIWQWRKLHCKYKTPSVILIDIRPQNGELKICLHCYQGDSGVPLVCGETAVGVTSFGDPDLCNSPELPEVYMKVSAYLPWIQKYIGNVYWLFDFGFSCFNKGFVVVCQSLMSGYFFIQPLQTATTKAFFNHFFLGW